MLNLAALKYDTMTQRWTFNLWTQSDQLLVHAQGFRPAYFRWNMIASHDIRLTT